MITDTGLNPVTYLYFMLQESSDGQAVALLVPGGAGRFLAADDDPVVRILARRIGVGSFQDVATTPLSLSWADPADVEVKAHANSVTGLSQSTLTVRSTRNP